MKKLLVEVKFWGVFLMSRLVVALVLWACVTWHIAFLFFPELTNIRNYDWSTIIGSLVLITGYTGFLPGLAAMFFYFYFQGRWKIFDWEIELVDGVLKMTINFRRHCYGDITYVIPKNTQWHRVQAIRKFCREKGDDVF